MSKGRRNIRLRTLLIVVAGCAILCGLGVQIYRELSPVRRSTRQLRPGNSTMTRIGAISTLANAEFLPPWEREEAYRVILATVHDPDAQVRARAAVALSGHGEHADRVVATLLALLDDEAPWVRESVLVALERIVTPGSPGAPSVIHAVIPALNDPKPAVRLEAVRALYVLGQGTRAVPALARLMREETGSHRLGALGWLKTMKTIPPDLEPTLRAIMTSDLVRERISARQALMQLGISDRERDEMIEVMLKSLHNAERFEGAQLLVQLGRFEQAGPVLREIAARGSNEDRAQADALVKWARARADALRPAEPTPAGPDRP
jgi:HEAT repeat protein